MNAPLPAVLTCDPPWEHRDKLGVRGARAKYQTMSTEAICKLALPAMADRRVLFLWRLSNMPHDALDVCKAWGFEPLAEIVWQKLRPCQVCAATGRVDCFEIDDTPRFLVPGSENRCPACVRDPETGEPTGGTRYMGLGTTVRNAHETCIIARPIYGRAPERLSKKIRSYFAAPMLIDIDGELPESDGRKGALVHSAKPDAFFDIVTKLYPGPRVEMFSRRTRPGWSQAFSNQDDKLDEVARKFREVWPARVREERLAAARRSDRR